MFDAKTLNSAVENAPEAGFVNINYGKLTVEANIVSWVGGDKKANPPVKATKQTRPMKAGEQPGPREKIELTFKVDIQEFNPALTFQYDRNVTIEKTNTKTGDKTDWSEIVLPSLLKVFGANWAEALAAYPYVAVEDTPNAMGKTAASGKVFSVPMFIAKYANAAECAKARDDKFSANEPAGKFPKDTVEQVKGLLASMGGDTAQALTMLKMQPFGAYDADELLAEATK